MKLTEGKLTFQWFQDHDQDPNPPKSGNLHGTLAQHMDALRELNARGAGIYFTVNQTDLRGRKKENITRVRAYMIDCDGLVTKRAKIRKIKQLFGAALKPSLIVETRNGLHVYWYSDGQEAVDPDDYRRINTRLAHALGGDMNARDIARVMRVPGFQHQKDPSKPYPIKKVSETPELVYSRQQILDAFPPSPEELEQQEQRSTAAHAAKAPLRSGDDDAVRRYTLGALEAECLELTQTGEGNRNHRLNRAAFKVGQLLHAGGVTEAEAVDALTQAALAAGLERQETNETIRSGISAGKKRQRPVNPTKLAANDGKGRGGKGKGKRGKRAEARA